MEKQCIFCPTSTIQSSTLLTVLNVGLRVKSTFLKKSKKTPLDSCTRLLLSNTLQLSFGQKYAEYLSQNKTYCLITYNLDVPTKQAITNKTDGHSCRLWNRDPKFNQATKPELGNKSHESLRHYPIF